MAEIYNQDHSIQESTVAHQHPLETTPQGSQADSAEGQHEHRDVNFGVLAKWFTGLFIGIAASFVLMFGYFNLALNWAKSTDEIPSHTFTQRAELRHPWPDPRPPSPLQKPNEMPMLLPDPQAPMQVLRKDEDDTLSTYNWEKDDKGQKTGGVTIPIDRAIDLTAERGLPSENKTAVRPTPAQGEVVRPGDPR